MSTQSEAVNVPSDDPSAFANHGERSERKEQQNPEGEAGQGEAEDIEPVTQADTDNTSSSPAGASSIDDQGSKLVKTDDADHNVTRHASDSESSSIASSGVSQRICEACNEYQDSSGFVVCRSSWRSVCEHCAELYTECVHCTFPIDVGVIVKTNMDCDCHICEACFKTAWQESLTTGRLYYPPKCCDSGTAFAHGMTLLSDEVQTLYKERHTEFSAKRPVSCAVKGCGKFLADADRDPAPQFECGACLKWTCASCYHLEDRHTDVNGRCPRQTSEVFKVDGVHIVTCPNCTQAGEKRGPGCDTLKCPSCLTTYCAICGHRRGDGAICENCEVK